MSRRKAVFLDRDGTLLDELGYLDAPEKLRFLPDLFGPLLALREQGYFLCVLTNQSGVARGYFDEATLAEIHAYMSSVMGEHGVAPDGLLYCPHHPDIGVERYRKLCQCRKPRPGLFLEAARRFELDLEQSFAIGDSLRDLQAAEAAGIQEPILVLTGKGLATQDELSEAEKARTRVVPDMQAAVRSILSTAS